MKLGQFRGESTFSTWLHRLTVNACRDVAQRQLARRCEPLEEDPREARDSDPARAVEASELRAELGACLATIPLRPGDRRRPCHRLRFQLRGDRRDRGCGRPRSATPTAAGTGCANGPAREAPARQGRSRRSLTAIRSSSSTTSRSCSRAGAWSPTSSSPRRTAPATFPATRSCRASRWSRRWRRRRGRRRAQRGGGPGPDRARGHRRRPLQAGRASRRPADARVRPRDGARPDRPGRLLPSSTVSSPSGARSPSPGPSR